MKKIYFVLMMLTTSFCIGQNFEEASSHMGITMGAAFWVDKGPSEYQALVVQGYDTTATQMGKIYHHQYTAYDPIGTDVLGLAYGNAQPIDANQDGLMDFIVTGEDSITNAKQIVIFTQNPNGSFTENPLPHTGITLGTLSVGDLNHDGIDDFIITGMEVSFEARLYLGDGNGNYTEQTTPFFGNINGSIEIFDANNNGFNDVLLSGFSLNGIQAKLYINDGSANFTEQANAGISGFHIGGSSVGDYNNDGNIDVLLNGMDETNTKNTVLYENDGNGNFTEVTGLNLESFHFGTADFVDYNNDGQPDIFLTGFGASGNSKSVLYTNNNGVFIEETQLNSVFDGVNSSSVFWADYDHDGDLDLVLSGVKDNDEKVTKIYKNKQVNCIPQFINGSSGFEITDFSIRNIYNLSPENGQAYENFIHMSTGLDRGEPHQVIIGGFSPNHPSDVMIYIDFNNNNIFDDPGESFYLGQMPVSGANSSLATSIFIEDTIQLGHAKMRIIKNTNTSGGTTNSISSPCQQDLESGQTEDYLIEIKEPPNCPLPGPVSHNINNNFEIEFNWQHSSDTTNFSIYEWALVNEGDPNLSMYYIENGSVPVNQSYVMVNNLPAGEYDFILTTDCGTDTSNYLRQTVIIEYLSTKDYEINPIKIHPNPAKMSVKIQSTEKIKRVHLMDMNGKLIMNKEYNSNDITINLDQLTKGIYLLKLETAHGIKTRKLIKE